MLDLGDNKLKSLPDISYLKVLQSLNLSKNNFTYLNIIKPLSNLSYVNLSKNQLNSLPEEFYNLPDIYTLNLS